MSIKQNVFWDDLAKDLEDPTRLKSFMEIEEEIRQADELANAEFIFTASGHPCETQLLSLHNLKDGWLDGEGKRITLRALEVARDLSSAIVEFSNIEMPSIFPMPDGGIEFQWSKFNSVYNIEISPWGKREITALSLTQDISGAQEFDTFDDAIKYLMFLVESSKIK